MTAAQIRATLLCGLTVILLSITFAAAGATPTASCNVAPGLPAVGVSIGVACFPQDGADAAGLLARADAAMYAAKSAGRNCWRTTAAAA